MSTHLRRLRWPLLAAASAALILTTTSAVAGSGVGGVFNLGQSNSVDATSSLTGTSTGAQLGVANAGTGSNGYGVFARITSTSAPATSAGVRGAGAGTAAGVTGSATNGTGVLGTHGASTGSRAGVEGDSASAGSPGLLAKNTAGGPALNLFTNGLSSTFGGSGGLNVTVGGVRALRLEPGAGGAPNLIGGSSTNGNSANNGATGLTVGGGGQNQATDNASTVAGGGGNVAGDLDGDPETAQWATVGGGLNNRASGPGAVVAGGLGNFATDSSAYVGGGNSNVASGSASVVGGGGGNNASGILAVVPGGAGNIAGGTYSFAAGNYSHATHDGSFVWSDDTSSQVNPTSDAGDNQFITRASGGYKLYSSAAYAADSGVVLAVGGGSWSSLSDRHAKHGFRPVRPDRVLRRLNGIPITAWSYKAQKPSIRHLGPMAQDFSRAFGLGEDRRHIDTIDSEGVSLAAIQGLYRQNLELKARLARLERKVSRLQR